MPSKKQRAKAKKDQVRSSFEFLDHKKDTPHMKKLQFARAHYLVQKMLGRPIKKYNLLYTNDDGDWFSSEDDLTEGLILNVLRAKQVLHPGNCQNWVLMYTMLSKDLPDDRQYFFYANLAAEPEVKDGVCINPFEYFGWKELKEQ